MQLAVVENNLLSLAVVLQYSLVHLQREILTLSSYPKCRHLMQLDQVNVKGK